MIQINVARTILSKEEETKSICENFITQLMDIKERLDSVINLTFSKNVDQEQLQVKEMYAKLDKISEPPSNIY